MFLASASTSIDTVSRVSSPVGFSSLMARDALHCDDFHLHAAGKRVGVARRVQVATGSAVPSISLCRTSCASRINRWWINEAEMAPMRFSIGLVLALALCACNSTQGTATASKPKLFGLISGDLPPAKEFVVETRSPSADYPAVGVTPP